MIAATLILLSVGSVSSQQAPKRIPEKRPDNQPAATQVQQAAPADKRGTPESPLIVKTLAPPDDPNKAEEDAKERADKRFNDRIALAIAGLTFLVLCLQTGVFGWQAHRLKQTIATMKGLGKKQSDDMQGSIAAAQAAARAAEKSASVSERALTELEGPFLYPIVEKDSIHDEFALFRRYDHPTSPHEPVKPHVYFFVRNYGRTVALPRSIAAELVHWTEMVPEPRVDFAADHAVQPIIASNQDSAQAMFREITIPIDKDGFKSLRDGKSRIFLYGEILFGDIFGGDYTQTFCLAYDFKTESFVPWGSKYNQRKRKEAVAT